MKKDSLIFAAIIFVLLVASRLVPHPDNFTAMGAIALFAGSYWNKKSVSFAIPMIAMFVVDLYAGLYPGIAFNYMALALGVVLAPALNASALTIVRRGLWAAIVFFIVSNFGVWLQAGFYPLTLAGLERCFMMGIPFFKNLVVSTWIYSLMLFATYRLTRSEEGLEGFFKLNYGRQK